MKQLRPLRDSAGRVKHPTAVMTSLMGGSDEECNDDDVRAILAC